MPRKAYLSFVDETALPPTDARTRQRRDGEARRKSVGTAPRKSLFVHFVLGCRATAKGRSSAQPTKQPKPRLEGDALRAVYIWWVWSPARGSLST